jgi:hypothetical protein
MQLRAGSGAAALDRWLNARVLSRIQRSGPQGGRAPGRLAFDHCQGITHSVYS